MTYKPTQAVCSFCGVVALHPSRTRARLSLDAHRGKCNGHVCLVDSRTGLVVGHAKPRGVA